MQSGYPWNQSEVMPSGRLPSVRLLLLLLLLLLSLMFVIVVVIVQTVHKTRKSTNTITAVKKLKKKQWNSNGDALHTHTTVLHIGTDSRNDDNIHRNVIQNSLRSLFKYLTNLKCCCTNRQTKTFYQTNFPVLHWDSLPECLPISQVRSSWIQICKVL